MYSLIIGKVEKVDNEKIELLTFRQTIFFFLLFSIIWRARQNWLLSHHSNGSHTFNLALALSLALHYQSLASLTIKWFKARLAKFFEQAIWSSRIRSYRPDPTNNGFLVFMEIHKGYFFRKEKCSADFALVLVQNLCDEVKKKLLKNKKKKMKS